MAKKDKKNKIRRLIVSLLENSPKTRRELIDGVLIELGFSSQDFANTSVDSIINVERSYVGSIITDLERMRSIRLKRGGKYELVKEKLVVVSEGRLEGEIISNLQNFPLSKGELYEKLEVRFGTDKTFSLKDDLSLRQSAGNVLRKLRENKTVFVENNKFHLAPSNNLALAVSSNTPEELKFAFLTRICLLGGEFFEKYFVSLLAKFYAMTGKIVLSAEVLGGSSDGGVDGVVQTQDYLGFRETVMIQLKCRENIQVTEKELRSFYGAVCAKKGTQAIFATTSYFHNGAKNFLNNVDNLIGVDGDKLFDMALKARFGIKYVGGSYKIDTAILSI